MVVHGFPGLVPIDARLRIGDLRRVGDAGCRLRRQSERAALERGERAADQIRADRRQHIV